MRRKPAVVQVTELLMDHKQTNSSLAFCKTPVTTQLRLAKPVVLQRCWGINSLQPGNHVSSISLSTVLIKASPNQTPLLQQHNRYTLRCTDEDQQSLAVGHQSCGTVGSALASAQLYKECMISVGQMFINSLVRSAQEPPNGMNDACNLMPSSFSSRIKRVCLLILCCSS